MVDKLNEKEHTLILPRKTCSVNDVCYEHINGIFVQAVKCILVYKMEFSQIPMDLLKKDSLKDNVKDVRNYYAYLVKKYFTKMSIKRIFELLYETPFTIHSLEVYYNYKKLTEWGKTW